MDGETCIQQAYEAIFHGDYELAIYWFGQAIAVDSENASYHYSGSVTCARSGKLPLALNYAKRAVELDPDNPTYQLNYRMIVSKQRIIDARQLLQSQSPDYDQSLELLKEAVQLDPLSVEAKLLLGIVYKKRRNYKLALDSLRDALQLDPQQAEVKRLLHEVRVERRRLLKQQYSLKSTKRNR